VSTDSQTDDELRLIIIDLNENAIDFSNELILDDLKDLLSHFKKQMNIRIVCVLACVALRPFGHSWRDIDAFLRRIGGMRVKTARAWTNILVNKNFDEFIDDGRGEKHSDGFWDVYPDLKIVARHSAIEECLKREASFTIATLENFIDRRFYEINDLRKVDEKLVRSIDSCRLDLRSFGAKFMANKSRPYFLRHERDDVVKDQNEFVQYFFKQKPNYYSLSNDPSPQWVTTRHQPAMLFCK
jgi:hypothetical protein